MANVTVSVIMPVYGVEDYVGGAIESIQAQTLTDWELFCVDDGSKDRSGEVCDSYAAKDPRIHVIHKENGGAPSARNVAIDKAEGKYLYFCDADDWAEKTMLEDMVSIAEENGSQLVVAGFYIDTYYSDTEKFTQCQEVPSRVFATQREFREHAHELFDQNLLYTPWNKLFLASYIKDNKLYFPQTFWDDFPFNLSVVRDLRLVFFEVETHALEALVDGVIVDDLAHRVDIGLRFQVILDLIDRPFHTEAEAGTGSGAGFRAGRNSETAALQEASGRIPLRSVSFFPGTVSFPAGGPFIPGRTLPCTGFFLSADLFFLPL